MNYSTLSPAFALSPVLWFLTGCSSTVSSPPTLRFVDVTTDVGLHTEATWKYGGPTLADLNNDGRYDLVLSNHHEVPADLFYSTGENRFEQGEPVLQADVHGIAAGDYDADGRVDLIVSVGGGNGKTPAPPRLLRNTGNGFDDVTEAAGIADLGARGRSVRWVDLDSDGDLDLLEIVARQLATETGPRNILFENLGDGTFEYRRSAAFESMEAERVLITDIDNDHIPDLVTFTPLAILKGDDNFGFIDVSEKWLARLTDADRKHASAVSEADIDNDGDMDLYVARGKTHYELANNSLELDQSGRMNLRDEGSAGEDYVEFLAGDSVGLLDFWHWQRGVDLTLPVYLGASRKTLDTPASETTVAATSAAGFPPTLEENGWYLGYLGGGRWKLAWNLNDDLAWGLRASVTGVKALHPAWEPQNHNVPDLLLINEGTFFRNASDRLPAESGHNNWGVITADFDNDADADFFVWRYGQLNGRIPDVMLINNGDDFVSSVGHGATNVAGGGHGDMGAPLDYDGDGWIDILSGSENAGVWNLFRNLGGSNNSITIRVGNSPGGVDAHGARVIIETTTGTQFKRVGSAGAVHSQGLNNLVHFGLAENGQVTAVRVRWRDGNEQLVEQLPAGSIYDVGAVMLRQTP